MSDEPQDDVPLTPLTSVVLPAFDGEPFIADAIASVRGQTLAALEIVVVDDGSTDSTPAVVRRLGSDIRYFRQERKGPAAARNRGVAAARGTHVAFIDQDDLWPPDHLATLARALGGTPGAAVAMGLTQALVLAGRSSEGAAFAPYGSPWRAPQVGCALFEKEVFAAVGPFNERLRYCSDDLDWFMRAREQGVGIAETDAVTLLFRIHETNTSRDASFRRSALLEAVGASIRRRQSSRR